MNYRIKYDQIAILPKRQRGFAFEKLINEIYDDCKVLINNSYKTADGSQQIDGAIEISSKIFLLEAKWEKKETLAASKLYSFIGKINSKIEGTLGIFISHNELGENFTNAIRDGLRQNCIIIHGKEDIENIIDGNVDLAEYTKYCFQKASTGSNKVDTTQFMSIPKVLQQIPSSTPSSTQQLNSSWSIIYNSLTNSDTLHQFTSNLIGLYSTDLRLSNKLINLFPTLPSSTLIDDKLKEFINKLIDEEKVIFVSEIEKKLKSDSWRLYVEKGFLYNFINKMNVNFDDRIAIIENVTKNFSSDYNLENDATEAISLFYNKTDLKEKQVLAFKYVDIYCDRNRADKFPQKQFANDLFNDLKKEGVNIIEILKSKIKESLLTYKNLENIFHTDTSEGYDLKAETIDRVLNRYQLIFQGHLTEAKKMLEEEYDKL